MKKTGHLAILFVFLGVATVAHGQIGPIGSPSAAVSGPGFNLPQASGSFTYSLSASQTIRTGYGGSNGVSKASNVSGNAGYISGSATRPFSLLYSGGYLFSESKGQSSYSFQELNISQALKSRNWSFTVADGVSYLPTTPTTGLSGIPGLGDIGVPPIQTRVVPGQSILTNYSSTSIANFVSGSAERRLTGSIVGRGSGSMDVHRFLGGVGLDSTEVAASGGPGYRLDARGSVFATYTYSRFEYGAGAVAVPAFSFISQGVNLEYQRNLTRKLNLNASLGPQQISSSSAALVSSQLNLAANLVLSYAGKRSDATLAYVRGANNGSGVIAGATRDNLGLTIQRILSRSWSASAQANYAHMSSLPRRDIAQANTYAFFGGVQVSRALGRDFSSYLSYNAQAQSIQGSANTLNAFHGLSHVVGIGLTFAPRSGHLGHP